LQSNLESPSKAVFHLAKGFTSPAAGFKYILIFNGLHITILGGGLGVVDAHSRDCMFVVNGGTLVVDGVRMQNGVM
jgi:hypothetical protein